MTPGSSAPWELAGSSAQPPLKVPAPALPWHPFPFPCARCSVVYISSPGHGAYAPRDLIPSLVLAHGAPHEELGVGWNEPSRNRGCNWVVWRGYLAARPAVQNNPWGQMCCSQGSAGPCPSRGPYGVMLCLYILYKGTCPFPL